MHIQKLMSLNVEFVHILIMLNKKYFKKSCMKLIKLTFWVITMIMIGFNLSSCGSDDSEEFEILNPSENNSGSSDSTYELLKKNISATVGYGDYGWNIVIRSNLANVFPGKLIYYGVESGYGSYQYYEHFTFNKDYVQKNDGKGNMTISYPVFVGNEYGDLGFYWYSYKALKAKKANGETLSTDEKQLWNEIVEMMSAKERIAKSEFCGRLYAQFDNKRYIYYTFGQVPSGSGNSTGEGTDDGGTTSYEKPDVGFYDFTATKSSLKVQYKIYNSSKAKVTSAKIYYGTSSNPSTYKTATVSGTFITVNITGLKAGTTYYVKCMAVGKGGTSTTTVTKCITNYN